MYWKLRKCNETGRTCNLKDVLEVIEKVLGTIRKVLVANKDTVGYEQIIGNHAEII